MFNKAIIHKYNSIRTENTPFNFRSKFLKDWCAFVKEYVPSNYRQIELLAIQAYSAILAYYNQNNLLFFILDISDSGTGKTTNKNFQLPRLFQPIDEELEKDDKDESKDLLAFLVSNKVSIEGLYLATYKQPKFFVDMGEVGNDLKSGDLRVKELLNTLTDKNAINNTLTRPVYKNAVKLPRQIKNVKFFLFADTNLQQLGNNDSIIKEYLGGLFNRFLIIYTQIPKKEQTFNIDKPTQEQEQGYQANLNLFIQFAKKEVYEIILKNIKGNASYKKLSHKIYSKKTDKDNEYKELYNRIMQNVNALIMFFHYAEQFALYDKKTDRDSFEFNPIPTNETINEAIAFVKPYINLDKLIIELDKSENTKQNIRNKILAYIKKKPNCTIRHILQNRAFRQYNANNIRSILDGFILENSGKIEILA